METGPDIDARRLTIHCGGQKSGATSLHPLVGRNRAALAARLMGLTPEQGARSGDLGPAALAALGAGRGRRTQGLCAT